MRSEKDTKKINSMTAHEKEIRKSWQQFKLEQSKKKKQDKLIHVKKEDISKIFSQIFK